MQLPKCKTLAVLGISTAFFALPASAQQAGGDPTNRIVGMWMLSSADDVKSDGSRTPLFGPQPKGMLVFDQHGRYSLQICSSERPKFGSNSRATGTAEENQAAVRGCNPHWGRYTVDASSQTIVFQIDHAFYPNWEGTKQARTFTISGDELRYSVPNPSVAGAAPIVVWKRAPSH
jgi:hypothetical protein